MSFCDSREVTRIRNIPIKEPEIAQYFVGGRARLVGILETAPLNAYLLFALKNRKNEGNREMVILKKKWRKEREMSYATK